MTGTKQGSRQRIRVCLRSYEHKLVDVSAEKIVETAKRTDAKVAGPIPLPTKDVFIVYYVHHTLIKIT